MWQSPSNLSTDGDWRSGYVPSTCPAGRQIHSPLRLVSRPGPPPFYAFRPRCPASRSVTHWPAPTCRLCLLAAPAACPDKMLSLQRISFEAMAGPCQPGTSCTQCMCHLSQAMAVTHSSTADTSLCLAGFRTALSFPTQLGGAALSDAALARLQQCPPADGPCVPQANATVFATLGPGVAPSWLGNDAGGCLTNNVAANCAAACLQSSTCTAFTYNPRQSGMLLHLACLGLSSSPCAEHCTWPTGTQPRVHLCYLHSPCPCPAAKQEGPAA